MSEKIRAVFDRVAAAQVEAAIPDDMPLIELADQVVRGKIKLSPQQMRMLIELLPYTAPKLAVVGQVTGQDLATLLDKRLEKLNKQSQRQLQIEDMRGRR